MPMTLSRTGPVQHQWLRVDNVSMERVDEEKDVQTDSTGMTEI
jgi:hypothetical protein